MAGTTEQPCVKLQTLILGSSFPYVAIYLRSLRTNATPKTEKLLEDVEK